MEAVATNAFNSPDFNFLTTNIDSYVDKNPENAFRGIPLEKRTAVINSLKTYQRLSRVSIGVPRQLVPTPDF